MSSTLTSATVLAGVPTGLRDPLLAAFSTIIRNYREGRWEPSELNGGKLCEIVYCILKGHVDGRMPSKPSKPRNMVDACRTLEGADDQRFPRSVRIQIPRMLISLYEIRNNRGVGHVGGDVDPNKMDARVVLEAAKWVMADLIRVFHGLDTTAATAVVDSLVERTVPVVWEVTDTVRRVLDVQRSAREQTLLLLYSSPTPLPDRVLSQWVEYSSLSDYKRDVLRRTHKTRLIDYDEASGLVRLSPTGAAFVEDELPLDLHP